MHGAKNYPLFKEESTLDIELADKTSDAEFLETLGEALPRVITHDPDLIFILPELTRMKRTNLDGLG